MKISDSDKPKLIILICLVILVFAYGGYRLMNPTKPAAPVVSESSEKTDVITVQPEVEQYQVPVVTSKSRDPFEPQVVASTDIPVNKPTVKPNEQLPIFGGNNSLPPIIVNPGGNQVVVVPESLPNFTLMGVVTGERNLAVIRGNGTSRYMVYEGQYIEGKYLVKSITKTSVSIQYRDRITVLKLGGKDAAQN
ncbi:MAG: hypothetical protein ACYC0V_03925 [Armatimonadota bacterium]